MIEKSYILKIIICIWLEYKTLSKLFGNEIIVVGTLTELFMQLSQSSKYYVIVVIVI